MSNKPAIVVNVCITMPGTRHPSPARAEAFGALVAKRVQQRLAEIPKPLKLGSPGWTRDGLAVISPDGHRVFPNGVIEVQGDRFIPPLLASDWDLIVAALTAPVKPKLPKPVQKIPKAERLGKGHGIYRRKDLTELGWAWATYDGNLVLAPLIGGERDGEILHNTKCLATDYGSLQDLVEAIPVSVGR